MRKVKDNPNTNQTYHGTDILTFGRYKGFTVADTYVRDWSYIKWMYLELGNVCIITEEEIIQAQKEYKIEKEVLKTWDRIKFDTKNLPEIIDFS